MNLNFYTNQTAANDLNVPIPTIYNKLLLKWMIPEYYLYDDGWVLIQKFNSPNFKALLINSNLNKGAVFHTQVGKDWCAFQYMLEEESIISPPDQVPFRVKRHQLSPLPSTDESIAVHTFLGNTRFLQLQIHKNVIKEWNMDANSWKGLIRQWETHAQENTIYKSVESDPRIKYWINKIINDAKHEKEVLGELKNLFRNLITLYMELKADAAYLASLSIKPVYKYMLDIWKGMRAAPDKTRFKLINLAKAHHRTPKNISIHYKQIFGEAISDALHKRCMERAVYWLTNTEKDFASIAKELGYINKTSLYNALKERFDVTVEEIRNNA